PLPARQRRAGRTRDTGRRGDEGGPALRAGRLIILLDARAARLPFRAAACRAIWRRSRFFASRSAKAHAVARRRRRRIRSWKARIVVGEDDVHRPEQDGVGQFMLAVEEARQQRVTDAETLGERLVAADYGR